MKTSLIEIAQIEKFLFQELPVDEQVLFQAKNILDKELKMKVFLQKKIYRLLNLFHKKALKKQAEEVYFTLMENPEESAFRVEILTIFKEEAND